MKLIASLMAALSLCGLAHAQSFLDINADPAIPTLEQEIGHAPGDEITRPEDAIAYMEALAEAAREAGLAF